VTGISIGENYRDGRDAGFFIPRIAPVYETLHDNPVFNRLTNSYLLLRHGRSLANQAGIIISNSDDGIGGWGLAEGACIEVVKSLEGRHLPSGTIFYTSPFKRALETARCAAESIGSDTIIEAAELGERYFGKFDKSEDRNYLNVWQLDAGNPENTSDGVESSRSVFRRMYELILDIDQQYVGKTIILVSHGDPLDILLTAVAGMEVSRHRDIESMKTAELRPLLPRRASDDC